MPHPTTLKCDCPRPDWKLVRQLVGKGRTEALMECRGCGVQRWSASAAVVELARRQKQEVGNVRR